MHESDPSKVVGQNARRRGRRSTATSVWPAHDRAEPICHRTCAGTAAKARKRGVTAWSVLVGEPGCEELGDLELALGESSGPAAGLGIGGPTRRRLLLGVIVIDARDDLLALDILRTTVDPYRVAGKQDELLAALARLPGVVVTEQTSLCSGPDRCTTCPRTSCGSASASASWTAPTSRSPRSWPTRSA